MFNSEQSLIWTIIPVNTFFKFSWKRDFLPDNIFLKHEILPIKKAQKWSENDQFGPLSLICERLIRAN